MIQLLQAKNLSALSTISHGYTTRCDDAGGDAFDCSIKGAQVATNWGKVAQAKGLDPARMLGCNQVHGSEVVIVTEPWALMHAPQADGLVTKEEGLALAIQTADCAPILLCEPESGVIGAFHAGWRSALADIASHTITAMEKLGAEKEKIQAAIGPCIWQDSYEVDVNFLEPFVEEDSQNIRFFIKAGQEGHYMFDLPAYVRAKLLKSGIASCEMSIADTYQDPKRFFSYRRDKTTMRLLSFIALNL
ncbi:MAG: peptidoglycan editing factor PgeF [Proteobacteria bacterium]|jgi:YfiH family protein|nr:peptidoglycan editing factor PgeF [Alphaproteobacteria bacterium]NCC02650.1 peptidoglycan editing factor PgeF [Pseudomonadota bacterium]